MLEILVVSHTNQYHFYLSDIELASGKGNANSLSLVGFDTRWK